MTSFWKNTVGKLSLAILVLTLAISIVILFAPFYSWTAQALDLAVSLGMSHDRLMDNYHALMTYLNFPFQNELVMPDFPSSESGLFHFYEVKRLFMLNYVLLLVSGVGSFFYLRRIKKRQAGYQVRPFFKGAMLVPPVFVLLIALNFDWLFLTFHQVFFNNDAWIFDPQTDPIILALPQEFFLVCFALVFLLVEVFLLLGYFWSKKQSKVNGSGH